MVSWMWAISGTEVRHVAALIGERWHRLAAESDASSPPWKHAFGPKQAQAGALPVGGGDTGALALWFMPASRPHQAPMGWKPLSRGNKSVGSASWQAQARPHRHGGHMGSCHCTMILAPTKASPTPGPVVVSQCPIQHPKALGWRVSTQLGPGARSNQNGFGGHGHHEVRIPTPAIRKAIVRQLDAMVATRDQPIT